MFTFIPSGIVEITGCVSWEGPVLEGTGAQRYNEPWKINIQSASQNRSLEMTKTIQQNRIENGIAKQATVHQNQVSISLNYKHETSVLIPCCRDIIEEKLPINSVVTFVLFYLFICLFHFFLFILGVRNHEHATSPYNYSLVSFFTYYCVANAIYKPVLVIGFENVQTLIKVLFRVTC